MKKKTVLIVAGVAAAGVAWWLYQRNKPAVQVVETSTIETTTAPAQKSIEEIMRAAPPRTELRNVQTEPPANLDKVLSLIKKPGVVSGLGYAYAFS